MRVLIVEDDPAALRDHVRALRRRGLAVDGERTVRTASAAIAATAYDALVLRRRLADGDGATLRRLVGPDVAVVVLAGSTEPAERLELLLDGVDDCIPPPVAVEELALRLTKAIARRTCPPARVQLGRVLVDRIRREVTFDGRLLDLTPSQMCVLDHLVAHRHRIVPAEELLEHCWDERSDMFSNPVASQITRLRAKLAGAVEIVWAGGVGYLLEVVDDPRPDDTPDPREGSQPSL